MPYELPALPYPFVALEPSIDAKTMEIHHDKHHAAYVTNLNAALATSPNLAEKSPENLIKDLANVPDAIRPAVRNNGGGHVNHSFFWKLLTANSDAKPVGKLAEAITATFGDVDQLKEKINAAGLSRFGSGWAWLYLSDVWEHAYYLDYQNRRADYLKTIWTVINWAQAEANYLAALQ